MPDVTIRRVTPADAAATAAYLKALRHEVAAGELDTLPWREPKDTAQQAELLQQFADNPRAVMLAAFDGETVVGIADIVGSRHAFESHCGTLGISVAKARRGQGIGRQLMQAAIAEAKAWQGFCRIELIVVTWNTNAIALYEQLGFRIEGRKRKAVNFRGLPEDEFLMALVW